MNPVIEAALDLAELLERENDALRRLDLPTAMSLLATKRSCLVALESADGRATAESRADPAMRALAVRLFAAAADNKRLLERAIAAQQHIMSLFVRAARKAAPPTRYGSQGGYVERSAVHAFALRARA